jgi:cation diffusion facilitator CzcD-associated flavoprotein CzcO
LERYTTPLSPACAISRGITDAQILTEWNRRWNVYPGARVDSEVPIYQLSIPEVYNTWTFSTNYPDWRELQAYFDHVDKVCNLSKDTAFETVVTSAEFDQNSGKWTVKTADGRTARTRFLIIAAGFAAKRYVPDFKSMENFRGIMHHSSFWPPEDVDVRDKRVAVIGTGASGVQIIQEWGPNVKHLTVFQRTPNLAIPMGKRDMTAKEQEELMPTYPQLFDMRERCFAGFTYDFNERNTFDDTPEEREAFFESLWKRGGFALWLGGYKDYLFSQKSNREAYNFWAKKQRQRITNPAKRDVLCPLEPPHPFGVSE